MNNTQCPSLVLVTQQTIDTCSVTAQDMMLL